MQMTIAYRVDVGITENPHTTAGLSTGRGVVWQTKGCKLADRSSNSYGPLASRFIHDERRVTALIASFAGLRSVSARGRYVLFTLRTRFVAIARSRFCSLRAMTFSISVSNLRVVNILI